MAEINGKQINLSAWMRLALILVTILTPGYFAFRTLSDTVALISERMDVSMKRMDVLEQTQAKMLERQSARIPIFDRMIGEVDDHETRIEKLEREQSRPK